MNPLVPKPQYSSSGPGSGPSYFATDAVPSSIPTGPRSSAISPRCSSTAANSSSVPWMHRTDIMTRCTHSDGHVSYQPSYPRVVIPNYGVQTDGQQRQVGSRNRSQRKQGRVQRNQQNALPNQYAARSLSWNDRFYKLQSNSQQKIAAYTTARDKAWKNSPVLELKVVGYSAEATPYEVYKDFYTHGNVVRIELLPQKPSFPDRIAFVTFRPPPKDAFWESNSSYKGYKISISGFNRDYAIPDPLNHNVSLVDLMMQEVESIEFGFMVSKDSMMSMWTCETAPERSIEFELDLKRRNLNLRFDLVAKKPGRQRYRGADIDLGRYQLRLRFEQLSKMSREIHGHSSSFIVSVDTPPKLYRIATDIKDTFRDSRVWSNWDCWIRQTDATRDEQGLRNHPINLQKDLHNTVLDIGRWTTYKITSECNIDRKSALDEICTTLTRFNVQVVDEKIKVITREDPGLWSLINASKSEHVANLHNGNCSLLMDMMMTDFFDLSFATRYQLEVCLTQGILHESNITRAFLKKLAALDRNDRTSALGYLEKAAVMEKRIFQPMDIFRLPFVYDDVHGNKRAPRYCTMARSAIITPTMIYYTTPAVEISNRVIRDMPELSDRFLRVRFKAEKGPGIGRLFFENGEQDKEISARIRQVLTQGIVIGDRKYEFLAFGNSQFREHGAYFFAPTDHITCKYIRDGLGQWFREDERVPSKVVARLGQNFSTTRGLSVKVVAKTQNEDCSLVLPDIKRNGYCFTDGVGKISSFLATMIAEQFGFPSEDYPSVYQFRLGGCKGVLAVDPALPRNDIQIRRSQYKFAARHEGLEIVRASNFVSASLNRQLILILSVLGVPDQVFKDKLLKQLSAIERALVDENVASSELERIVDVNHTSLTMSSMVMSGFMRSQEPFMMSMLQLWRSWMLKYLKEKAKINVDQGAFLFGCIDETGTLRGHFNNNQPSPTDSLEERIAKLPEVFCFTDGYRRGVYEPIEGVCIVARNPSLHPGDIRVVHAIDVPHLHHLKNVVVFPQTGDRDISNMCSGGDLDGDDYIIISDPDLIPKEWTHPAMDFTPPKPRPLDRPANVGDLIEFFMEFMKSDRLGMIANAHLALSDFCVGGPKDERCIELAKLHSHAVDYPKSGVAVNIPSFIRNIQWPHFMEKQYRTYKSTKILGQLYDEVVKVDFCPDYESPFDKRILNAYAHEDTVLEKAKEMKRRYDNRIRQVMAQHGVATEFEIWSGFIMKHSGDKKDYTIAIELGNVVEAAKKSLREDCIRMADAGSPLNIDSAKLFSFVAAMYTVTAREIGEAISEHKSRSTNKIQNKDMPFMSFPWLFMKELGQIARYGIILEDRIHPVMAVHEKQSTKAALMQQADGEVVTNGHVVPRGEVFKAFDADISRETAGAKATTAALAGQSEHSIIEDGERDCTVEVFIDFDDEKTAAMDNFLKMMEVEND